MQAFAASVPKYPLDFPIPDRAPYSYQVDMGVVRSAMAAGNTRQRRLYKIMPHFLALSFHMRVEDLTLWQGWANQFAYQYFTCPVSTMYAGQPPDASNMRYEVLRFTSDLQIAMDGWNWVSVTVAAELSGDAYATFKPIGLGGWIVGGYPAAPSPAWMTAGTPAAPAADWTLAGTPNAPAALVGV
jgi:hypothetical protein